MSSVTFAWFGKKILFHSQEKHTSSFKQAYSGKGKIFF